MRPGTPCASAWSWPIPPSRCRTRKAIPPGVSVDLARALAEYLHEPLTIENIPFNGLIPALKTGKIDAVISSMTETPERAQSIDFSDPYLRPAFACW